MGRGEGQGRGAGDGSGEYKGKTERFYIPAMPLPVAIICCVLNVLVPGLGTIVAGFSNFCCSRNEDMDTAPRFVSCCINIGIGFLQLVTTVFFFLGWFWSCVWGGFYIVTSAEYYHNNREEDLDHPNQAVITHQPQIEYVYPRPGASRPDFVIIRPQHIPYTIVPGPNDTGNVNNGFANNNETQREQPPTYEACQTVPYNQIMPGDGGNPPPYPGPPTAPPYSKVPL